MKYKYQYPNVRVGGAIMHKAKLLSMLKGYEITHGIKVFNAVYDSLNWLKWSGGRCVNFQPDYSLEELFKIVREYNSLGIKFVFVFTNFFITEDLLNDEDCNKVLEEFKNTNNEVIVANELLANYIKKQYPSYNIIYSASLNVETLNEIYKITNDNFYSMLVVSSNISKNFDLLKKINSKDKIEIIIDETCIPNCPYRQLHYENMNKWIHEYSEKGHSDIPISCFALRLDPDVKKKIKNNLNSKEIQKLIKLGYNNLKLTHRESPMMMNFVLEYIEIILDAWQCINNENI